MIEKDDMAYRYIQAALQSFAPFRTGNLSMNSIRILSDEKGQYVAIGGEIAPYAKYTNEGGKHEGWIKRAKDFITPTLRQIYSGELTDADIAEITNMHVNEFKITQNKFADSAQEKADKLRSE